MDYVQQQITDLTTHNMPIEYADYDETYTYQISVVDPLPGGDGGALVKYGNYYYRTLINDNIGFPPEDHLGTKWIRWGVSNAFAMLDLQANSKSYWTPDFTTTGATQVVDITIGDIVFETAIGYWEALTTRAAVDLDLEDFGSGVAYTATTATQVVDLGIGDIVYNSVTEVYWKSLLVRAATDLDTDVEIYEEGVNWTATDWKVSANELVVEFNRADIDTLVLGNYAATLITVEALDDLGVPIDSVTQTRVYGPNYDVEDYYSYIYSQYTTVTGLDAVFDIPFIGIKIRVTFHNDGLGAETSCGFLIGGIGTNMGETLYGVGFSFNSYSVKETDDFGVTTILKRGVQDLVDFETEIPSEILQPIKRKIKLIYDEIVVFILDPVDTSVYENMITLGIVDSVSTTLNNSVQTIISWSVQEVI